jgi:hypothetical protein
MVVGMSALLAGGLGVASAITEGSTIAAADTSFSALQGPHVGPDASADPELRALQADYINLQLVGAVRVIDDADGTIWLSHSTAGELCVIEEPADTSSGVSSRFGCRDASVAAQEGVVAGIPGHWYGVVPDGVPVSAIVRGAKSQVRIEDNAFRLPSDASGVVVGTTQSSLAGPPAQVGE